MGKTTGLLSLPTQEGFLYVGGESGFGVVFEETAVFRGVDIGGGLVEFGDVDGLACLGY